MDTQSEHKRDTPPLVYTYLDYRTFLRDYYDFRKGQNRGFSHRFFARRAGFSSPSFLKLVIEGKRNLSEEMAERFAEACRLDKAQAAYFCLLVRFDQAKSSEEKQEHYKHLVARRRHQGIGEVETARYAYFSTWYLPAIRELSLREDFQADPAWISQELWPSVPVGKVVEALDTLKTLGLLSHEGERSDALLLTTAQETGSILIASYHREMLERAAQAIDLIPAAQRDLSALVLCLGDEGLRKLKERMQAFRRELLELSSLESDPQKVVQVNFQLFPLSKGTRHGKV